VAKSPPDLFFSFYHISLKGFLSNLRQSKPMPVYTDQLNRSIHLRQTARRIVSLVPSQTELLYYLGLLEEVVGVTKFCVHPRQWFTNKTRVGGTKSVNIQTIHKLEPDLIIANKEENQKEQINELEKHYPVWISDINNLESAYDMIKMVGEITNKGNEATILVNSIQKEFHDLPKRNRQLRTCYLIWRKPYMLAGGNTFINDLLRRCGFCNVFEHIQRYPEITIEQLKAVNCELLLLSSEPFPFKEKHIEELQQELPDTKIAIVNGELFSWYGSRLLHAPAYFKELISQVS
jgi:ABC-type Fe3+-hydroxamate transport system substrate-binding protein